MLAYVTNIVLAYNSNNSEIEDNFLITTYDFAFYICNSNEVPQVDSVLYLCPNVLTKCSNIVIPLILMFSSMLYASSAICKTCIN